MVIEVAGMDGERATAWSVVKKFDAFCIIKNVFPSSSSLLLLFSFLLLLFYGTFRMMSCTVVVFKHVACVTCLHSQTKLIYSFEMFAFVKN